MLNVRSITFTLPLLYRAEPSLEIRATTERMRGKPLWPAEGSSKGVTVEVHEWTTPREVFFAMFAGNHPIFSGSVKLDGGHVTHNDRRLLPLLGERSLFDVNIIPGLSRKEHLLF